MHSPGLYGVWRVVEVPDGNTELWMYSLSLPSYSKGPYEFVYLHIIPRTAHWRRQTLPGDGPSSWRARTERCLRKFQPASIYQKSLGASCVEVN